MSADYRDLLKRYMRHVESEEGTTFMSALNRPSVGLSFSKQDIAELNALEEEAMAEHEKAIAAWHARKAEGTQP